MVLFVVYSWPNHKNSLTLLCSTDEQVLLFRTWRQFRNPHHPIPLTTYKECTSGRLVFIYLVVRIVNILTTRYNIVEQEGGGAVWSCLLCIPGLITKTP